MINLYDYILLSSHRQIIRPSLLRIPLTESNTPLAYCIILVLSSTALNKYNIQNNWGILHLYILYILPIIKVFDIILKFFNN